MRFRFWGDPCRVPTRHLGVLVVCTALLAGCGNGPRVHLHVCGDIRVPKDVDALGITLLDAAGNQVYNGSQDLFTAAAADGGSAAGDGGVADGGAPPTDGGTCTTGQAQDLPLSFDLRLGHGDMWVIVQGFEQGAPVIEVEGRVRFPTQGAADVTVGLTRDCLGVHCAYGQTCVKGTCQITAFGGTPSSCTGQGSTGKIEPACEVLTGASP